MPKQSTTNRRQDRRCCFGECREQGEAMILQYVVDMTLVSMKIYGCTHHRHLAKNADLAAMIRLTMKHPQAGGQSGE